jgi:hypothetical protein
MVVLDTFSGERGSLAPWRNSNLFSGTDVLLQVDGAITGRPSYAVPWTLAWDEAFSGQTIRGLGIAEGSNLIGTSPENDHLWFILDDTFWIWEGTSNPTQILTLPDVPVGEVVTVRQGSTTWIANPEKGLYRYTVTNTGPSLTTVSNVVPGAAFAVWQGVELCAGSTATGTATPGSHRLYWSDSPGSWPASTNYNDIGDSGSAITALFVLRNQLLVAKDDGSWWMVTGELATTDNPDASYSIRDVSRTNYPIVQQSSGYVNEQIVAFVPDVSGFPVTYNGSQFVEIRYLVDPELRSAQVIGGAGIGDLLIHKSGKGLLFQNNSWVRITTPVSSKVVMYNRPSALGQFFVFVQSPDALTTSPPKCYLLPAEPLEDPIIVDPADPTLEVDPTVTFAEIINDQGLTQTRDIRIYYRRIDSVDQETGFNVLVEAKRYPTVDGSGTLPAQPGFISRTTTTGTYSAGRYVATVNVGHTPAYAFEVTISNIKGCAIERVVFDPKPSGVTKL